MSDLQPLLTAQIIPPERAEDYLRAMDIEIGDLYIAVAEGVLSAEGLDHFAPPRRRGWCAGSAWSPSCVAGSRPPGDGSRTTAAASRSADTSRAAAPSP